MVEQNENKPVDGDELIIELDEVKQEDQAEKPEEKPEPEFTSEDPDEDELKTYSNNVQKRIKQLSAQRHAERRKAEELQRQVDESARISKRIYDENNILKKTITDTDTAFKSTRMGTLDEQLASAKAAYKAAYESADPDALAAATDQLSRLHAEKQTVSTWRPRQMQPTAPPVPQAPAPQLDQKTVDWQEKNQWFGRDTRKTGFALGVHQDLVARGVDPRTDEYFSTIDAEMRRTFPSDFGIKEGEKERTRDTTVVAPATRGVQQAKKVRLSASQVALAKKLGITNELYAKEFMKLENNNG